MFGGKQFTQERVRGRESVDGSTAHHTTSHGPYSLTDDMDPFKPEASMPSQWVKVHLGLKCGVSLSDVWEMAVIRPPTPTMQPALASKKVVMHKTHMRVVWKIQVSNTVQVTNTNTLTHKHITFPLCLWIITQIIAAGVIWNLIVVRVAYFRCHHTWRVAV